MLVPQIFAEFVAISELGQNRCEVGELIFIFVLLSVKEHSLKFYEGRWYRDKTIIKHLDRIVLASFEPYSFPDYMGIVFQTIFSGFIILVNTCWSRMVQTLVESYQRL